MINSIFSRYFVQIQAEKEDACVQLQAEFGSVSDWGRRKRIISARRRNTAYDTESPREGGFWDKVHSNLILIKTKWNLWYLISLPFYYLGVIVKDSAGI